MKNLFFLCSILCLTPVFAQTPLIAHKSHSGSAVNYFIDPSSNFGAISHPEPRPIVREYEEFDYFEALNDSVIVKHTIVENQQLVSIDTLTNMERYTLEEFKVHYLEKQKIQQSVDRYKKTEATSVKQESVPIVPAPRKENSPSFLLIFFAVSAVGMIIMRLFRSSKDISPLIP